MRWSLVLTLVLVTVGALVSPDARQRAAATEVLLIEHWVAAVMAHRPGDAPDALAALARWSPEERQHLADPLELFEHVLLDKGMTKLSPSTEEGRIAGLARDTALAIDASTFLERAAVLHADAAMAERPTGEGTNGAGATEWILERDRRVTANDGRVAGSSAENWNWAFARDLLALVPKSPEADAFIAGWYHATTAYLFSRGLYVQAERHLSSAAKRLPDDPVLLFDRGCRWESLGLPFSQQVLTDEALLARRLAASPNPVMRDGPQLGAFSNVPLPEVANRQAEDLYRDALKQSASFAEPRIRLARLLMVRGRDKDARTELERALDALSRAGAGADPTLQYYAHLFLARVLESQDDLEDASLHVRDARQLFPNAQSAMLAESELALKRSDLDAAEAPVDQLMTSASNAIDPWWDYHLCAGREVAALVKQAWAQVSRVPGGRPD